MDTETNEVRVLKDSENGWIVKELEKITGYKPWFIKEQLGIPLVDVSGLSQQELKEATDMLGYDIDDASTELSLSALMRRVEAEDETTLWDLFYKTDYYSKAKYAIFTKLLTFADTFSKSYRILSKIYSDDIISVESEELLNEALSVCSSQASLQQSEHITSIFRGTHLTKESAAQARLISEAQLKFLVGLGDYKKFKATGCFGGMDNWVAAQMLLTKLKMLIEKSYI